jgi:hypothetical protein
MSRRSWRGLCALALLALAALLASACGVNPPPPEASLETLDSLLPRARARDPEALGFVTPAGGLLPFLSDPYAPGAQVHQVSTQDGINVFPSFSEGASAAYAITEYWDQFPEVWAQPLYFLTKGFNTATGGPIFLDGQPVFSVGTASRFYSSYWQIYYVTVPASFTGTTKDLSSEKLIFDSGYPIAKGALTFCAIGPQGTNLAWAGETALSATGTTVNITRQPLTHAVIPLRGASPGWVEQTPVWYIDFGRNRYQINDDLVVEADALYKFALRGLDGSPVPLGLPSVGGTGPQGQWRTPVLVQGVPEFGSLWHEYLVLLNPANGQLPGATHPPAPFIPIAKSGLRAQIAATATTATGNPAYGALYTPLPDPSIELGQTAATINEYTLRVARNPFDCFEQPNPAFPGGPCVWLDSQLAVEGNIGEELIVDTQRLSSCPLLWFNGAATP